MNIPLLAAMNTSANMPFPPWLLMFIPVIIALAIWDAVWKLIALWKSARNDQLAWFICLAIINTIGILPIVYILFFQNKRTAVTTTA